MFDEQSLYFGGVHIAGLDNGVGSGLEMHVDLVVVLYLQ